jgi:Fur family transcriptional regulator, iron response regulator
MKFPQRALPTAASADEIGRRLLARGIRPTPQRIDIARIFLSGNVHLSAEQVLARVSAHGGVDRPVSKATVYNTLGLLAGRGLLTLVSVDPTRTFYDSNTAPHYHFYNVDDGTLTDVVAPLPALERLPVPPAGTVTAAVDVVIRIRNRPTPAT